MSSAARPLMGRLKPMAVESVKFEAADAQNGALVEVRAEAAVAIRGQRRLPDGSQTTSTT
jgi:hypothetical protein